MSQIFGYTAEFTKDKFAFKSEKIDLTYSNEKMSIRVDGISFGDVGASGLLKTIADPYLSDSLVPRASAFSSKSEMSGTVFNGESYMLFSTTSYRYGIGAYYTKNSLESFVYYAGKSMDKSLNHRSYITMLDYNVLYYGIAYNTSNCNTIFLSSYSNIGTLNSFVSFTYKGSFVDLEIKIGNIAELKERKETKELKSLLKIKKNIASISFEYVHYEKAIYVGETRPFNIAFDFSLKLNSISLSGKRTIKLSRKGLVENETKLDIEYKKIKLAYQNDGLELSMKFDDVSFSITKNGMSLKIDKVMQNEALSTSLSFKSGESIEVSVSISN